MWSRPKPPNAVGCCEFHFYEHAVSLWNRVVLARIFLSHATLAFVHDQPSASSLRTQKYNLSYFTDELEHFSGRFRAAVTHLQSLTTGLCPGNAEETSRRWTPKHLRYLQNVSEDHHLLLQLRRTPAQLLQFFLQSCFSCIITSLNWKKAAKPLHIEQHRHS
ncbi:hypothetical protein DAPPUDRAFT_107649 [Daphnia pulex]|uniref:Uncharacterized protein n=1 Tax=Daphnia pulex TaxID=6669 RepID=E9GXU0_DAPPU|nr:hypothetical protein DAPPUDRAFT_107649 [Daphnia pulex]|eukprot:EFX75721.1 hypothetical protein DAPPUDRAFT_107649 [Daphnia pulex]